MWDCASSQDLLDYYSKTGSLLSGIDVPQMVYVVPTLYVMMKPISYSYAHFIMILLILLRMLPMSFLLKFITRFQTTLFQVGMTSWSETPIRLLENLFSSCGLLGALDMVLCMI